MSESSPRKEIRKAVLLNLRGLICVAAMWGEILNHLSVETTESTLDGLDLDLRVYLRAIYAAQPGSLASAQPESPLLQVVVRWCRRGPIISAQ